MCEAAFHRLLNPDKYSRSSHHSHIGSVGFCRSDAAMLHDELVRPPLLPSITAVVAETPGAVHQHLLGQNLQGTCLEDKSWTRSHSTRRFVPLMVTVYQSQQRGYKEQLLNHSGGAQSQGLQLKDSYFRMECHLC